MKHPLGLLLFCPLFASVLAAATPASAPITPREVIPLFNGKDLTNFYTWEDKHGREDPNKVFTVVDQIDGAPAIRMSGQHWGGIVTTESYTNYKLVVEFRWGLITWEPRMNRTRDVEHPVGEWNRIEIICDGDTLSYYLNGTKVNELLESSYTSGRLLFQSEAAEIFFRKIELHPLKK